jgi:ABC-2 type transport system permease protein
MRAGIRAFLLRDLQVARSYPLPFILEVLSILFTVASYFFLSKLVDPLQGGADYFSFVLLGLLVSVFLSGGLYAIGSNVRHDQLQGTLEPLFASGLSPRTMAAGMASYPVVAASVSASIYLLVGVLAGASFSADANPSLTLAALVMGAVSFVGLGLVGAALVLVFKRAAAMTGWLVALLTLAGGEFFPVILLPTWFERLSALSPYTQTLRLVRDSALAGVSWADAWPTFLLVVAMSAASLAVGVTALARGLALARRSGGGSTY